MLVGRDLVVPERSFRPASARGRSTLHHDVMWGKPRLTSYDVGRRDYEQAALLDFDSYFVFIFLSKEYKIVFSLRLFLTPFFSTHLALRAKKPKSINLATMIDPQQVAEAFVKKTKTAPWPLPPPTSTSVAPIPTVVPDVPTFEKIGDAGTKTLWVNSCASNEARAASY